MQSIKDRLQNKETFELQCVWCNHHFNNIGAIDYNVITLYVQIMYTVPSWEFLSPIFLSTSTSESSSKSEAFTKKKKNEQFKKKKKEHEMVQSFSSYTYNLKCRLCFPATHQGF